MRPRGIRTGATDVYTIVRSVVFSLVLIGCGSEPREPPKPAPKATPAAPKPSTAAVTGIAVGIAHTCALHADHTVSCWGLDDFGQLGVDKLERSLYPLAVPGVTDAVEISARSATTCIRRRDDSAWCWGSLGIQSKSAVPAEITRDIVQLGGRCFRTRDGHVQCLDNNAQLRTIEGLEDAVQIGTADGYERGCAVRKTGFVACWNSTAAVDVPDLANVVEVAVGNQLCGVTRKGTVWCSQAVDAKAFSRPVQVMDEITDARGLVAGEQSICVRTTTDVVCSASFGATSEKLHISPSAPIAAGLHTCFVKAGRDVQCWGNVADGEMGNGWWRRRPVPTRVPGVSEVVELGGAHRGTAVCARKRDQTVVCWGNFPISPVVEPLAVPVENVVGFAGTDTIRLLDDKGRIQELDYEKSLYGNELHFKQRANSVAQASDHCFVSTAGRVRCWRSYMGADPEDPRYALMPKIEDAVEVRSYNEAGPACVRRRDGGVACFTQGPSPLRELPITDAIAIAVADGAQCAIRADHTLWCWGNATSALFAPRLEPEDIPPTRIPIENVMAMSMVRDNICIVRTDGTVACWGANSEGQLGDGTFFARNRPSNVMGITDAVGVFVGIGFACAVHKDSGVSCWGSTDHGQIGTYATINVEKPQSAIWP